MSGRASLFPKQSPTGMRAKSLTHPIPELNTTDVLFIETSEGGVMVHFKTTAELQSFCQRYSIPFEDRRKNSNANHYLSNQVLEEKP